MARPGDFSLEKWLDSDRIRYYSLGRHALMAALQLLDIGTGDTVAVPEFICRDLLAPVAAVGARVVFYPVSPGLTPDCEPASLQDTDAVLAVNYFGFPQVMDFFWTIAAAGKTAIIEDNAHGFLSRDEQGIPLGTRGDVGIFSLRKSVPLVNGGALVVNRTSLAARLPAQLPAAEIGGSGSFLLKEILRRAVPWTGITPCRLMTAAARVCRMVRTGHAIAPSPPESEKVLPLPPEPWDGLRARLAGIDIDAEISRRRQLYQALEEEVFDLGGRPVFEELPAHAVPYVLPFRAGDAALAEIRRRLARLGLECHQWPELPDTIRRGAPEWYHNVWMVPFLW